MLMLMKCWKFGKLFIFYKNNYHKSGNSQWKQFLEIGIHKQLNFKKTFCDRTKTQLNLTRLLYIPPANTKKSQNVLQTNLILLALFFCAHPVYAFSFVRLRRFIDEYFQGKRIVIKNQSLKKGAPTTRLARARLLPTTPNGFEGQVEGQAVNYESQ